MSPVAGGRDLSVTSVLLQLCIAVTILAIWDSPLLGPLKLLVVLLHEMSHGLMALATGGTIESIVITPAEGGACHTTGGNASLIVSAGYLGSMFFGGLILSASRSRAGSTAMYAVLGFLLLGASFSVLGDAYSRRFALSVAASAIFLGAFAPGFLARTVLRASGTVCSLYAVVDIYNDILSQSAQRAQIESDALALSRLTGIDPATVGLGWMIVSLIYLLFMLRASVGDVGPAGAPPPSVAAARA